MSNDQKNPNLGGGVRTSQEGVKNDAVTEKTKPQASADGKVVSGVTPTKYDVSGVKDAEVTKLPKDGDQVAKEATEASLAGDELYGGNLTGEEALPAGETRKWAFDAPMSEYARKGGSDLSYQRPDYVG